MKRIALIDPWAETFTSGNVNYDTGFIHGMSKQCNVDFFCPYSIQNSNINLSSKNYYVFFKFSSKMKKGIFRKILRLFEYISGYNKILKLIKRKKYDDIHIMWCIMPIVDVFYLKKIKKYTKRLILTAHNIIPHIDGTNKIIHLKNLYNLFDKIIVHGKKLCLEAHMYFPELDDKLYVSKHGQYYNYNVHYNIECIDEALIQKLNRFKNKKIYLAFGNIFYNKGFDRLLNIWQNNDFNDALLIIAGGVNENYDEIKEKIDMMNSKINQIGISTKISDNTLNYLISMCDIVLLPYRHATMSGVIFSCANFMKTILVTNVGVLSEYLEPDNDSFLIENDDEVLEKKIIEINNNLTKSSLKNMGISLYENINSKCDWDKICKDIYLNVYEETI